MTITHSGTTPKAIDELINQRVAEALAFYEANRAAELDVESQSQNGDDDDNRNVGGNGYTNGGGNRDKNSRGNGNGNGGGNGNGNPNRDDRGTMLVAYVCTYHDFVKCQTLNFKGTEGVVRLTRWFEKMETVFHISNYPEKYHVKYATCTLLNSALTWWNTHKRTIGADATFSISRRELMKLITDVHCPRNEIQKMESELWNLTVKNNDLAAYTQRFQELTMMCTKMVPEEEDRVKKFIGGLPDNIQRNIIAAEPTRLQDAIRIANNLMDQKLKGYAMKNAENKRRLDNNKKDNHVQQPPYKRQNVGGQSVARAYTTGNNEKRGYAGPLPYCNKCKLHHEGPCTMKYRKYNKVGHMTRDCMNTVAATATQRAPVVNPRVSTYFKCGRQGHYGNEYPKLKNQTGGNKAGKKTNEARGKAYVLGGREANRDSNVITDVSYAVEFVDDKIMKTNTFLRGCTLGLLGHPFNIDLMPVEPGSFDVIIGMDWLANHHAVIVYDEKIMRIPYGDENKKEHEEYLRLFLRLLKREELYAKFSKYEFWLSKHILDQKELNMRQRRWLELLSDYNCKIRYHPEKVNMVVDALSRKERIKPLRVRALVMTNGLNLPKRILEAQVESRKEENYGTKDLCSMIKKLKPRANKTLCLKNRS
ncbi:reverse transcriptase domain-containing protein [Tanacetum coccineum]|uniref:Reverse transcriptase domain-containing protein n=1 Tax=Tanacetum coccineum TaxID=301880 RepID=A0ABQ5EI74_9ASTR